jgi:hypothetical protein
MRHITLVVYDAFYFSVRGNIENELSLNAVLEARKSLNFSGHFRPTCSSFLSYLPDSSDEIRLYSECRTIHLEYGRPLPFYLLSQGVLC